VAVKWVEGCRTTGDMTDKIKWRDAGETNFYERVKQPERPYPEDTVKRTTVRRKAVDFKISIDDILNSYPFYAMLVDENHYILKANSAVLDNLGMKPDEIVGQFCPSVVHGVNGPFPGCPLEEALERNEGIERDVFDEHSKRWLRSAIYPTRALTKGGKKIFFHMVTDITDTKHAESELRIAHNRLRRLSAYLESVREEERKKIARDLHDETSQVLASLSAHLEALAEALPANLVKAHDLLKRAQKLTMNVFDEISRLIYELRPTLLDELGLIASIRSLLENNLETAGIKTDIKISGRVKRLPSDFEVAIFRVMQEVVSNIARHSHAKNVKLRIWFRENSIKLRIIDDGIGFDVEEAISITEGTRGLGLLGIQERVRFMAGSVSIKSSPNGGGTRIDVEIPLNITSRKKTGSSG
jgi:PAS domain S-box-containing protein